jgi:hypothetical protein
MNWCISSFLCTIKYGYAIKNISKNIGVISFLIILIDVKNGRNKTCGEYFDQG